MIRVTGYGGVGEIGGNQLLLEDGDWQALLDFGTSFGRVARYFEEFLKPRSTVGTHDYLRTGLLPPLRGLYRPDLEALAETSTAWDALRAHPAYREDVRPAGVLLSHAHVDHCGYLAFLRPAIPVVSSPVTALTVKALQDVSDDLEREAVFLKPRTIKAGLLSVDARSAPAVQRPWCLVDAGGEAGGWSEAAAAYWGQRLVKRAETWETTAARPLGGDLAGHAVRAFAVDHSIPGALGFAVQTSAGWIGYTGDLRLHGRLGDRTLAFAEHLRALELELLICEGTQAPRARGASEEEVRANVIATVRGAEGLVIGDFGPRNIERLETFLAAAQAAGRRLVVLAKDALLLHALHCADATVPLPDPALGPLVFRDRRGRLAGWEAFVRTRYEDALVDAASVARAPGEFVLALSLYDLPRLLDIAPRGGCYIYSSSEPHQEEQLSDMRRLQHWVELFGMTRFGGEGSAAEDVRFHASGHAPGPDLLRFISTVRPRRLLPVHLDADGLRFYRDQLRSSGIEIVEPVYGRAVTVAA